MMEVEFTPSPGQTNCMVQERYQIRRNLLIKFTKDTLDQTAILNQILQRRFPGMVALQQLGGDHLTPINQDISRSYVGASFTPFDAISQWIKQEVYKDLYRLKQEVLHWLDPLAKT